MAKADRIGRFEVLDRIRGNSFALVYRGRDPFDGRAVQIKLCIAADDAIRRQFLVAAEESARLRHSNVLTVFEFGSGDSKPYLVQEAFSEIRLSDRLQRREPIDDVLKLYYLLQIARGLQHAHRHGVLHRELGPASVLVQPGGEVKLADFGIARLASAFTRLTEGDCRRLGGGLLLPELLLGLELDARSDIYGFGALAYELLTGERPFPATSLAEQASQVLEGEPRPVRRAWPECPAELDGLIGLCLRRHPGERFDSAEQLGSALETVLPMADPGASVEEESTAVTEEVDTVYVAEPRYGDAGYGAASSDMPSRSWRQVAEVMGAWASRVAATVGTAIRQLPRGARLRLDLDRARLRTAALVTVAAGLLGVVGWSLVGGSGAKTESRSGREAPAKAMATGTGLLVIDPVPWARVVRIIGGHGRELELAKNHSTPLSLQVPTGRYQVELSHPDVHEVESCAVIVTSSKPGHCRPQLAAVQVADYFRRTGWWQ